jgi:hypothetical protein
MNPPLSRLPRLLLASTVLLSAAAFAAEPPPGSTATGTASGKRMHKPYTVTAQSAVCPATTAAASNVASDPEEGGQLTAHAADAARVQPLASDPEEGGQVVARTAKPRPKPSISELTVSKRSDTASTTLAQAAPGGGSGCPAPR